MNRNINRIFHMNLAMKITMGLVTSFLIMAASAQSSSLSGVYLELLLKTPVGWVVGDPVDGYGTILYTDDLGRTWTRQGTTGEIPDVPFNCVSAVDSDYAWVVGGTLGNGVILRTSNSGKNWQSQDIPLDSQGLEIAGIYALDRNTAWAVGYGATILHTTNGGDSWIRQDTASLPDVPYYSVYASDPLNAWVIGDAEPGSMGTVLRTTDGGDTWVQVPFTVTREAEDVPAAGLIMVHGVDANTVWVVGEGKVSFTGDGGATWIDQWTKDMVVLLHFNGVFAVDRDYVWLARDQGAIYHSSDGGTNYTFQDSGYSGDEIMRISAVNRSTAWAVTTFFGFPPAGHVLFTDDGGKTWVSQSTPVNTYWHWVSFAR